MGATCNSKYAESNITNQLHDIITDDNIKIPPVLEGSIFGACHFGESKIIVCGEDKRVALFDWSSPLNRSYFPGHTKPINRVIT